MENKEGKKLHGGPAIEKGKDDTVGYPLYPASEDVYSMDKEEKDIDPEDISKKKEPTEKNRAGKNNEKDFTEDVVGGDLDVPGSEDDEKEENMGSEDEENNYYSLGGDGHNELDENKGE